MATTHTDPYDPEADPPDQAPGLAVGEPKPGTPPPPEAAAPAPFQRERFRDDWMATGTDVGRQNALLDQYGLRLDPAGRTTLPTGELMDLRIGAKAGQNLAGWTGVGPSGPAPGPAGPGSGVSSGGPAGAGSAGPAASGMDSPPAWLTAVTDRIAGLTATGGPTPFQQQMRDLVLQQMQRAQAPIDPNSPEVAQPTEAARLASERSLQDERTALAERLYAEGGGGSNELQQGIQQSRERQGATLAGLQSQLYSRLAAQKADQLQQALSLAVQSGDAEAARTIQMQLAQLDASLRAQQLAQQGSQFSASLAQQGSQFTQGLAQQKLLAELENALRAQQLGQQNAQYYAGLGEQQRQWNDSFGLEGAKFRYGQDRDVVNAGLSPAGGA